MPDMREVKCIWNLIFFLVAYTFHYHFSRGSYPYYTQKYFFLGSEQISRMALKTSKTAEFRGTLTCLFYHWDWPDMKIANSRCTASTRDTYIIYTTFWRKSDVDEYFCYSLKYFSLFISILSKMLQWSISGENRKHICFLVTKSFLYDS